MKEKILNFIQKRFPTDCNWLDGNCYYFAVILQTRFSGDIYYDVVNGHFVACIKDKLYDWTGEVEEDEDSVYVKWKDFAYYDEYRAERIIRDCIQ